METEALGETKFSPISSTPFLPTTRREFLAAGGGLAASSLLPFPLLPGRAAAQSPAPPAGPFEDERKAAALDFSTNTYQEYQPVMILPVNPRNPFLRVVRSESGAFELLALSQETLFGRHEVSLFVQNPDSFSGWRVPDWRS